MTPGARIAAAADIFDAVIAGDAAERCLIAWARRSRFAGSGDRSAVRDLVFDALRCLRSYCWLGGSCTGRGAMIGKLRAAGRDPDELFNGQGYAPAPLTDSERISRTLNGAPEAVRLDLPDWLVPQLRASLGENLEPVARLLRQRAPVFLRVNLLKVSRPEAAARLAADGIETRPHPLAETALEVTENPRAVRNSHAFREGLVELQDAASQAVVAALQVGPGMRVLDFCAGGGGKSLALAARGARVTAYDAAQDRMRDLPGRAQRAGAEIDLAGQPSEIKGKFDLVFCDAPCSGSGAWRRTPDAKWRLMQDRLAELQATQTEILGQAVIHVADGGVLAYATCSLLDAENRKQADEFLSRAVDWRLAATLRLSPLDGADGFFLAQFKR